MNALLEGFKDELVKIAADDDDLLARRDALLSRRRGIVGSMKAPPAPYKPTGADRQATENALSKWQTKKKSGFSRMLGAARRAKAKGQAAVDADLNKRRDKLLSGPRATSSGDDMLARRDALLSNPRAIVPAAAKPAPKKRRRRLVAKASTPAAPKKDRFGGHLRLGQRTSKAPPMPSRQKAVAAVAKPANLGIPSIKPPAPQGPKPTWV